MQVIGSRRCCCRCCASRDLYFSSVGREGILPQINSSPRQQHQQQQWQPQQHYRQNTQPRRACFLTHALPFDLMVVPGMCFTQECQANADRTFLLALAIPLVAAAAVVAYLLRPPPQELKDSGQVFEDEATGFSFYAPEDGTVPERDKNGNLAFRAISYTPWPVPSDFEGERLRIDVGPIAAREARTFVFNRLLPQPSELVTVTLPRPMGVVFQYDKRTKQAVVADVVEGSAAEQRRKVAGLNRSLDRESVQDGDILRGVTCTNFVYPTRALFGAVPPQRHVVVYGADKQTWASIRGALRKGEPKDGPVTLVLERRVVDSS
eukprot:GHRQ01007289.1.p1 GENE.GHRQ01007289.1~~GHRQ01007289.1.p1  ORF type:complete len:321 (+),score=76.04 GHRQ01007289.1:173-1135(+)